LSDMDPVKRQDLAHIAEAPLSWQDLAGRSVLITGESGFLPAYMVETLMFLNDNFLATRAQVYALARNEQRARDRFAAYAGRDDLRLLIQDVCDPIEGRPGYDYVIHAASQASPRYYGTDPVGTLLPNVKGTEMLLRMSSGYETQGFLFFSSGDVYGEPYEHQLPTQETDYGYLDPLTPRACYGESKRMGESLCAAYVRQFRVPARIVRPFHTYGPGMRLDDGRVFADFVRDILTGGPLKILGDGLARRCFCYLADATAAFFTVLLRGTDGEAYNVSNPDQECSVAELATRLEAAFADEGITLEFRSREAGEYLPSPLSVSRPDISKIGALGWSPETDIESGFLRTVASFRNEHVLSKQKSASIWGEPVHAPQEEER
jgi:UDP-glucuronate decarboxylase